MKKWLSIGLVCCSIYMNIQAQEYQKLAERQLFGTARYVGMAGAMTAIGGDASSVVDNPAALGLYRGMEVNVSLCQQWNQSKSDGVFSLKNYRFSLPSMSLILAFGNEGREMGMIFNNLKIGYNRLSTYDHSFALPVQVGTQCTDASEVDWGYQDQFDISWGCNISNQWYVGVGLNIPTWNLTQTLYSPTVDSWDKLTAVGVNASFGMIYRPCQWIRLGLSYVTPGSMSCTQTLSGSEMAYKFRRLSPMRASGGVALQVYQYGLISAQYDMAYNNDAYYKLLNQSIRIGTEWQVYRSIYVRAGYSNDFGYGVQYASAGLGWRTRNFVVETAYQYKWRTLKDYANIQMGTLPIDINMSTHLLVISLAWRN